MTAFAVVGLFTSMFVTFWLLTHGVFGLYSTALSVGLFNRDDWQTKIIFLLMTIIGGILFWVVYFYLKFDLASDWIHV